MTSSAILAIIVLVTLPTVFCLEILCDSGACCEYGELLSNQTLCRPARNECDAIEHCTGTTSHCPLDISIDEGTPCGSKEYPGQCVDGICWTAATKEKLEHCIQSCSKDHGACSETGDCVCHTGWISPPLCNVNQTIVTQTEHDTDILKTITVKRRRRSTGNKKYHHSNRHHSAPASRHHKHVHKPVALPRRIEDPPTEDTWERYSKHPLFIPIVVTIGAFVILLVFGIWATSLYKSEAKARKFKERIKVEKSRRHIPKDVSMIKDPSVNIDVGK